MILPLVLTDRPHLVVRRLAHKPELSPPISNSRMPGEESTRGRRQWSSVHNWNSSRVPSKPPRNSFQRRNAGPVAPGDTTESAHCCILSTHFFCWFWISDKEVEGDLIKIRSPFVLLKGLSRPVAIRPLLKCILTGMIPQKPSSPKAF